MHFLEAADRALEWSITLTIKSCSAVFHIHENTVRGILSTLWGIIVMYEYPITTLLIAPSIITAFLKTKMGIPSSLLGSPPPEGMIDIKWEETKKIIQLMRISIPILYTLFRTSFPEKDWILKQITLMMKDLEEGSCLYFYLLIYLLPIYFDTGKKIREWARGELEKLKTAIAPEPQSVSASAPG